jgi:hypothetical protein
VPELKKESEMGFRKDVEKRLADIETVLIRLTRSVEKRTAEVERLEKQNEKLFNRLMTIDFEKYALYAPENQPERKTETVLSPFSDENMAGEIIDDEKLRK